jgi:hypothetical protein
MQKNPDAAEALAGAYYVLQLLPLDPDQAEAILATVEHALAERGPLPDGWTEAAVYVFSHLSRKTPQMAAATLAMARDIINAVRPHFAQ